jgi:hypothetical protein
MKNYLALFVLLAASNAMALPKTSVLPKNGTVCSGPNVAFEMISHIGVDAFGPNPVTSHTQLTLNGQVVERIEKRPMSPEVDPLYFVTFVPDSKRIIGGSGDRTEGSETFVATMQIERRDGAKVITGAYAIQTQVTCARSWSLL